MRRDLIAGVLGACLCAGGAMAQTFPSKPIRIVVPFTPGGPNDILARMIGQRYTAVWGQQTLVDNRPGGGTVIGTDIVAKAPADGHTLLMVSTSHAANPSLMSKLPFDTLRDFVSVGQAVSSPNVLVVHPSVPARNTRELLDIAKARPGQITFASGGSGAATHLAGELLKIMGGVEMTHIPYKGAGPATIDLISGQVTWMFGTILPTIPHVRSGKLRALAVSGKRRAEIIARGADGSRTRAGVRSEFMVRRVCAGRNARRSDYQIESGNGACIDAGGSAPAAGGRRHRSGGWQP